MRPILSTIIFLLLFVTSHVFALATDRKEKVFIESDYWHYNYKTGENIYEGNVKVDQGTTHVTADKLVTLRNAAREIKEAIAYGFQSLAHYWTVPKIGDNEVHAYAKIIKFYPLTSNVTLMKNVTVKQATNYVHGELIHYNSRDELIILPKTPQSRALLVYDPSS